MKTFKRTQMKVVNGRMVSYTKEFTADELAGLAKMREARIKAAEKKRSAISDQPPANSQKAKTENK